MLGVRHGLYCLGCCWALMLVLFAVGAGNLAWMAALTGVMLVEKTADRGRRLVPLSVWRCWPAAGSPWRTPG